MTARYRLTVSQQALPPRELAIGSDTTLLEQLLAAGLDLPLACRNGNCGRCHARLVRGEASNTTGDCLPLCISHAHSDLQVELPPPALWQLYACQLVHHSADRIQLRLPAGKTALQADRFALLTASAASAATLIEQQQRLLTFQPISQQPLHQFTAPQTFAAIPGEIVYLLCVKAGTHGRQRLLIRQQSIMSDLSTSLLREIRESLLQSSLDII